MSQNTFFRSSDLQTFMSHSFIPALIYGLKVDSKLTFHQHVSIICDKAGRKLTALTRLMKILNFQQRRIPMKSFIDAQFNHCPLFWMFYSRTLNSKLNRLQERALLIVYCTRMMSPRLKCY